MSGTHVKNNNETSEHIVPTAPRSVERHADAYSSSQKSHGRHSIQNGMRKKPKKNETTMIIFQHVLTFLISIILFLIAYFTRFYLVIPAFAYFLIVLDYGENTALKKTDRKKKNTRSGIFLSRWILLAYVAYSFLPFHIPMPEVTDTENGGEKHVLQVEIFPSIFPVIISCFSGLAALSAEIIGLFRDKGTYFASSSAWTKVTSVLYILSAVIILVPSVDNNIFTASMLLVIFKILVYSVGSVMVIQTRRMLTKVASTRDNVDVPNYEELYPFGYAWVLWASGIPVFFSAFQLGIIIYRFIKANGKYRDRVTKGMKDDGGIDIYTQGSELPSYSAPKSFDVESGAEDDIAYQQSATPHVSIDSHSYQQSGENIKWAPSPQSPSGYPQQRQPPHNHRQQRPRPPPSSSGSSGSNAGTGPRRVGPVKVKLVKKRT